MATLPSCEGSAGKCTGPEVQKQMGSWPVPMGEVCHVDALEQGSGQECICCESTGSETCGMCMGAGEVQLVVP